MHLRGEQGRCRMSGTSSWKLWWLRALSDGVPRRSFYVALVVGTILNLINQPEALVGGASVNWFKIMLTYFVPYVVCTYGSVSSQMQAIGSDKER